MIEIVSKAPVLPRQPALPSLRGQVLLKQGQYSSSMESTAPGFAIEDVASRKSRFDETQQAHPLRQRRLPPKHPTSPSTSAATALRFRLESVLVGPGHCHPACRRRSALIDRTHDEKNHPANRRDLLLRFF